MPTVYVLTYAIRCDTFMIWIKTPPKSMIAPHEKQKIINRIGQSGDTKLDGVDKKLDPPSLTIGAPRIPTY